MILGTEAKSQCLFILKKQEKMMKTRRLFEEQVKTKEFEAMVLFAEEKKGVYSIVLDQTAFFPEGGGQPGDSGSLFVEGEEIPVLDTREKDGVIFHLTKQPLETGTRVKGVLNWDRRLRNMQNHSGEHILSGLIYQRFGYHNVGFHMGSEAVTLDLDGVISQEELLELEEKVNQAIEEDVEVEVLYPSGEELQEMFYRSKKEIEGQVRIVRIPGYDSCACCGTHVERTGEIRLLKILGVQNYKGGVRISMLAGKDALEDYGRKHVMIQEATHLLSVKPEKVTEGIQKALNQQAALKSRLIGLQRQIGEEKAEAVPEGSQRICFLEPNFQMEELREMVNKAALRCKMALGLLPVGENLCQYVLISNEQDVRSLGKELNQRFSGKGGGQSSMVQGTLVGTGEEIKTCFLSM
jgi:alanyl-tRNA synthetase